MSLEKYGTQEAMDSSACPDMSQMTITQLQGCKISQHFYFFIEICQSAASSISFDSIIQKIPFFRHDFFAEKSSLDT